MSISNRQTLRVITRSPARTVELGLLLGRLLDRGDVVALYGELGSGKTMFVKGIALGCGVGSVSEVTSPTFILMNEYEGRAPFYHFDAYRLCGADELMALGSHEYFEADGICAVEWADRVAEALPADHLEVRARHVSDDRRGFDFSSNGPRGSKIISELTRHIRKKIGGARK